MISLRDLHNRVYVDRVCIEFTYNLEIGERNMVPVTFRKFDDGMWSVFAYIRVNNSYHAVVFDGVIQQMARNMTLEEVCAQGLITVLRASTDMSKLFQDISFSSSKVVGDMPGMQ